MNIPQILDTAKTNQSLDSDNRLALALVVSRSAVSQWRSGSNAPDAQAAMKLADMAGLDRLEVLATCELHREKDPKRRQYWATFLPGLRRVAALVTACIAAALTTPQSAEAVGVHSLKVSSQCAHNINSRTFFLFFRSLLRVVFLQHWANRVCFCCYESVSLQQRDRIPVRTHQGFAPRYPAPSIFRKLGTVQRSRIVPQFTVEVFGSTVNEGFIHDSRFNYLVM